jgi:hypothetical protein
MPNRIGDFLLKIGAMSEDQVEHVLHLQEGGDARIFGEIALELGYLNDDAIKRYVDHMEKWNAHPGEESPADVSDL